MMYAFNCGIFAVIAAIVFTVHGATGFDAPWFGALAAISVVAAVLNLIVALGEV